jgi:hypothetical protein
MKSVAIPAWITAVVVVFGVMWMVVMGGEAAVADQKVLIVTVTEDKDDAWPVKAFDQALERGGQVRIRFADIRDAHPEIEDTVTNDGSYFTNGALIGVVTSKGWRYHSVEPTEGREPRATLPVAAASVEGDEEACVVVERRKSGIRSSAAAARGGAPSRAMSRPEVT